MYILYTHTHVYIQAIYVFVCVLMDLVLLCSPTDRLRQKGEPGVMSRITEETGGKSAAIKGDPASEGRLSRCFIHRLHAHSDSAHSPAVKPCHYPLVRLCLAWDRQLPRLAERVAARVFVCLWSRCVHVLFV